MKTPTYKEILPYIEEGLVTCKIHPDNLDVMIFNYSPTVQFSGVWDDVTRQCRGLIMNVATGEVLARPFPKFFNYQEHVSKGWSLPEGTPKVYEKLDGSLGIYYWLNDKPWIATRGSFTSDQALWATDWFRKNLPLEMAIDQWTENPFKGHTPLFEIVAPWNRIVVNYDFEGLVHLATISVEKGHDIPLKLWMREAREIPFTSLEEIAKLDEPNSEGFVIHYPATSERMKLKFPEYVRLHKVMTGLSVIGVWEHLSAGGSVLDLAKDTPDEFYEWLKKVEGDLRGKFNQIKKEALNEFRDIEEDIAREWEHSKELPDRRVWALTIKFRMKHPPLGFALLDSKNIDPLIWRMIRPTGNQNTFKIDTDL